MRVSAKPVKRYPWYLRLFFAHQRRKYGQVLEPALIWARVPRLFLAVALLYGALDSRRSRLSPVLRSLVTVRVSQLNGCRFCVDVNAFTLARRCGSMDKVTALQDWRRSELFEDSEKAALAYAERMTRTDDAPGDAEFEQLRRFFDDDALVELTALIAFQNLSSKFNSALAVPAQGFCRMDGEARAQAAGAAPRRGDGVDPD